MSAKYERIKKADLSLPAPLRWLTRAFSSITLAVILLSLVILYGTIASVPVFFLLLGAAMAVVFLLTVGGSWVAAFWMVRRSVPSQKHLRILACVTLIIAGLILGALGCWGANNFAYSSPTLLSLQTLVIYKLRYFEMTSQQFYGWWPLQTILILFVVNMIWATVRRIEFRFENLGVLTVHTGIVIMAVGALVYSHYRVEGDTVLFRPDLGGTWVDYFYDGKIPAIYITRPNGTGLTMPLHHLPRYNDYPVGSLNIQLDKRRGFDKAFGKKLHVTIPGFLSYAQMKQVWVTPKVNTHHLTPLASSPAIEIRTGPRSGPRGSFHVILRADVPADRELDLPKQSVDYLVAPSPQRLADLLTAFPGHQGLIVAIPKQHFRKAYPIHVGQTIHVGHTGYTLKIRKIGPYPTPFAMPAYQNAHDTRAIVHVQGRGKNFTRICFYRFPSLDQDFVPQPGNPHAGKMGKHQPPDPAIHLAYIDASKARFHLVSRSPSDPRPVLIARLPGAGKVIKGRLDNHPRFPLAQLDGHSVWAHITRVIPKQIEITRPVPVPRTQRKPKSEGTYLFALLPVRITLDRPKSKGGTWHRLIWLGHMQYPHPQWAGPKDHPVTVDVPGIGPLSFSFSRMQRKLPFRMKLASFHMTPYPGSHIPKNFKSTILIQNLNSQGQPVGKPVKRSASLNAPIIYYPPLASLGMSRVKISQVAWDAPQPGDPHPDAKNAQGLYIHQQRWTVLGIGNNVFIHVIALGAILMFLGIPWAFYIKPAIVRRRKQKIERRLAAEHDEKESQNRATADQSAVRSIQ